MEPGNIFGPLQVARLTQEANGAVTGRLPDRSQEMQQHDRALAFPKIASRLLAIERLIGFKVEQIVVDLKGDAGKEAKLDQRQQVILDGGVRTGSTSADHPNLEGRDHRVPAGLLKSHPDIVRVAEVEALLGNPAQLDRLTLGGFPRHPFDTLKNLEGLADTDPLRVLQQEAQGEDVGRITDVDCNWHPVRLE